MFTGCSNVLCLQQLEWEQLEKLEFTSEFPIYFTALL